MAAEIFEREVRRYLGEVYAGEGKSRVECEGVLPDYKEAAHRILRVDTKTRVNSKNTYLQGQFVICEVEGVCTFHVLYLTDREGEVGIPASFLTQENFTYTFKAPAEDDMDPDGFLSMVEVHPENSSYKLLSPRKLSLRTEIALSLVIKCNREITYYSENLPEDVKTLKKKVRFAGLECVHQEDLTFTETICLPREYPAIGDICQMDVDFFCLEITPGEGGVTVKGSCDINASYVTADEGFVSFYQPIEFQKNIGVPQCSQASLCSVRFTPNFLKASTDVNEEGENKNILFEIGATAEILAFCNEEVSVVEDAFSTKCRLEMETKENKCEEILSLSPFTVTQRGEMPLKQEGITRAEGIRSSLEWKDSYLEEGKIAVEGKVTFRYLGGTAEGDFVHLEETSDFKFTLPADPLCGSDAECRIEILGGVRGAELVPMGDKISFRYDLCGLVTVYQKKNFVSVLTLSKGQEWEKEKPGVLFYYPESGEKVWDLCKEFHTTPEKFCRENNVTDDTLPSAVCILPEWE